MKDEGAGEISMKRMGDSDYSAYEAEQEDRTKQGTRTGAVAFAIDIR